MKIVNTLVLLLTFIVLNPRAALAKKLVDDSTGSVSSFRAGDENSEASSYFSPRPVTSPVKHARKIIREEEEETRVPYKEAENGMELRKLRRMGVGLQAAGALGLGGAILDLNFAPQWSVTTGYGGGQGFQSFEVQGKYVLAGEWLMPYLEFGYARWSSVGTSGPITKTNPAILGDRLLNDAEKASGEFAKNLLYPGIGLQFIQLDGPWAGTSIYAEFSILLDPVNEVAAPTGALGMSYYF